MAISDKSISEQDVTRGAEIGASRNLLPAIQDRLREADSLCRSCLTSEEMLCSGSRLYPDETSLIGTNLFPCYRLASTNAIEQVQKILKSTGMRTAYAVRCAPGILDGSLAPPSVDENVFYFKKHRKKIHPGLLAKNDVHYLIMGASPSIVARKSDFRILDCVYIPVAFFNKIEERDRWFGDPKFVIITGTEEVDWATPPSRQFVQWILDLVTAGRAAFYVEASVVLPTRLQEVFST